MFTYQYPRPSVTADCVVFGYKEGELYVMLIERAHDPYKGKWALPGGFMDEDESAENAAYRELKEETGIDNISTFEQFYTFSTPGRDPRGHTVAVAFLALVHKDACNPYGSDDASNAGWFRVNAIPPLAFDHEQILAKALETLRKKAKYEPIGWGILGEKFTLPELHSFYEAIFGQPIRKEKFTSIISTAGFIEKISTENADSETGPVYFRFNQERYQQLVKEGIYLAFP